MNFRIAGTKNRSYRTIVRSMKIVMKAVRQAGGILKCEPTLLTRVVPCLRKRVCDCANMVLGMNVATRIGIIFNICLVSST